MVVTDYIPFNKFSRPGRKLTQVRGVVLHYTASPGASDISIRTYFERLKDQRDDTETTGRYASAHFVVDLDGSVIEMIPPNEMAYHCGATSYQPGVDKTLGLYPNMTTIAVELCHPEADGKFTQVTVSAAALLTAWLCFHFGLDPLTQVFRHYDVTGKICPKWWVDEPKEFDQFKDRVVLGMALGGAGV